MSLNRGEAKIPCTIWPGWFSHERSIRVDLPGAENIVAFVDQNDVFAIEKPTPEKGVDGFCRVYVVSFEDDSAVVDLPQQSINRGTRFRIPKECLKDFTG